jgi:hypothetical protein
MTNISASSTVAMRAVTSIPRNPNSVEEAGR